jgi:hypothetical protein
MNALATAFLLMMMEPALPSQVGTPIGAFRDPAACARSAAAMNAANIYPRKLYYQCIQIDVVLRAPRTGTKAPRWVAAGYGAVLNP